MTATPREVSRHRTSQGTVVYARRADGGLQVWLTPHAPGPARLVAEGAPGEEVEAAPFRAACA